MKTKNLFYVIALSVVLCFQTITVSAEEIDVQEEQTTQEEQVEQEVQIVKQYHVINVLGDSITEGVGASSESTTYPSVLAALTGARVNNYGLSCSRITDIAGTENSNVASFIDRMYGMDKSADLIVIFGGTNDYWYGDCPIGSREDYDTSTFYGALNTMLGYLKSAYPNADIVMLTPYRQGKDADETQGCQRTTYAYSGYGTMNDFRKAILDRCEYYNVPVLDLYEDYELNTVDNWEALSKYGQYLCDGVHLNDAGYRLLAQKIYDFVMQDFSSYVPAYTEIHNMVFETAALPCMIQDGAFVMPDGSVIACKNGVSVTMDMDLHVLYNYLIDAVFY